MGRRFCRCIARSKCVLVREHHGGDFSAALRRLLPWARLRCPLAQQPPTDMRTTHVGRRSGRARASSTAPAARHRLARQRLCRATSATTGSRSSARMATYYVSGERWAPGTASSTSRSTLRSETAERRRVCHGAHRQPRPEVRLRRQLRNQVGQPRHADPGSSPALTASRPTRRERLRDRPGQQPGAEIRLVRSLHRSLRLARPGTGEFNSPTGVDISPGGHACM